jgi:hypothetical protein
MISQEIARFLGKSAGNARFLSKILDEKGCKTG